MTDDRRLIDVQIRRMREGDLPALLAIESLEFPYPWDAADFNRCLRVPYCCGRVAEYAGEIVGYSVHELHRFRIDLLTIGVAGGFQLRGVGRAIAGNIMADLIDDRAFIFALVRERNLDAQLFFQRLGFTAEPEVIRGMYRETDEGAYRFCYESDGPSGSRRSADSRVEAGSMARS